eukprot:gene20498-22515_t
MIRRPKRGENEEDLLEFQEKFMQKNAPPAAKVVRMKSDGDGRKRDVVSLDEEAKGDKQNTPLKKSRFKERLEAKTKVKANEKDGLKTLDASELLDSHDCHITAVLSKIKEREIKMPPHIQQNRFIGGFPTAPHVTGGKKQSLFAKQFQNQGPSQFGIMQPESTMLPKQCEESTAMRTCQPDVANIETVTSELSNVITGEGLGSECKKNEMHRIHEENLSKLSEISEKDILEEQAKLKASLDPKILEFIKSKRQKATNLSNAQQDVKVEMMEVDSDGVKEEKENRQTLSQDERGKTEAVFNPYAEFDIKGDLPGMKIIEDEKLQWMKEPPKPLFKTDGDKSASPARFDLEGNLAPRSQETPFDRALHHHGDDQDAPGYTLEELFHLARCNFKQQRVFALQLLARIMEQYQKGNFRDHLQSCLLKQLIEAGLPFLLRWSLDDNTESIFSAAVYAFRAMLTVPCDDDALAAMLHMDRGLEIPALKPVDSEANLRPVDKIEQRDLTDPEMMSADLVKGLLQVQILPRLRYILEVCDPSETTVNNCMAVLTRIVAHSSQSAYEVLKCPRLIETICSHFLPLTWKEEEPQVEDEKILKEDMKTLPTAPLESAMRLLRFLCMSARSIASKLWADFDVCSRVLRYVSLLTRDGYPDGSSFIVESLHIWRIGISFGIDYSTTRDVYPLLITVLQKFRSLKSPNEASNNIQIAIIYLCEAVIQATSSKVHNEPSQDGSGNSTANSTEKSVRFSGAPTVDEETEPMEWKMVEGMHSVDQSYDVFSCLLLYLSAYVDNAKAQKSLNKVDVLLEIETLMKQIVLKLINSKKFLKILPNLKLYSDLLKTSEDLYTDEEAIPNLPNYGMNIFKDASSSCLKSQTPFKLVSAVTKLLFSITTFHKGCSADVYAYVTSDDILAYLKAFTSSSLSAKISYTGFDKCDNSIKYFYHLASLKLLGILQDGEEYEAKELLLNVIMQRSFFTEDHDVGKVVSRLSGLQLTTVSQNTNEACLKSNTMDHLLKSAVESLPHICDTYATVCFRKFKKRLVKSKNRFYRDAFKLESFFLPQRTGTLLPLDWVFLPIIELYHMATNVELSGEVITQLNADAVRTLEKTLLFILLLEVSRPDVLQNIPPTIRLVRLFCIFLIGNDAFLESPIYQLLQGFLKLFTSDGLLEKLDFETTFPGISSFYDLYSSLLVQYCASSFGDHVFSNFLLIALQQKYDCKYRKALWMNGEDVLRVFPLSVQSVLMRLENFLEPNETDEELLGLYLLHLSNGDARPSWCPFLYLVGVNHLSKYIFDVGDVQDYSEMRISKSRLHLLKKVISMKNEDVRSDIIMFDKVDVEAPKRFQTFQSLPRLRQIIIEKANEMES